MKIADKTTVLLNYVLKKKDGTILETTNEQGPVTILFGYKMFPKAVEDAIEGKDAGDSVIVEVDSQNAFGKHSDELVSIVPKSTFKTPEKLVVGGDIIANDGSHEIILRVTAINGDEVTVDANHPYAGLDVVFEVGIMDVRETTPEDMAQFYPQQEQDDCDCSSGCGSCCGGCDH
ncbi:MAG: peptidylprolyl isomerase [Spirochaetales bacterium]|nr:peptidylprolyl isomerase [Spirochaetales bacterium]